MNPNTYDWYQCDEEEYNSNDSPEEQRAMHEAGKQYATQLLDGMRAAVATVPSYCERDARAKQAIDEVQALVADAQVIAAAQHWTFEACEEDHMLYLKAQPESGAQPCWRWSLVGGNDLIQGTDTLVEDAKEILFTYSAYNPPTKAEYDALCAKMDQALEQADDDWSGGFGEQAYQDSLM